MLTRLLTALCTHLLCTHSRLCVDLCHTVLRDTCQCFVLKPSAP